MLVPEYDSFDVNRKEVDGHMWQIAEPVLARNAELSKTMASKAVINKSRVDSKDKEATVACGSACVGTIVRLEGIF